MKKYIVVAAPFTALLLPAGLHAQAPAAAPLIDIMTNPGCGQTGLTREQKTDRNRRLAYNYVESSHQWPKYRKMYNWSHYGCWAEGAKVRFGSLSPIARPMVMPKGADTSSEARGYRRLYPDFGAQPETLYVFPFEQGFYYNVVFGGHHKESGKYQSLWETGLVLVNDAGKITLWDFWNDNTGLSAFAKDLYGIEPADLTLKTYIEGVMREQKDPQ